jgi:hypothetical protein
MPYTINKISYSLNLLKKKVLKKYSYGIAYNKVKYTKTRALQMILALVGFELSLYHWKPPA